MCVWQRLTGFFLLVGVFSLTLAAPSLPMPDEQAIEQALSSTIPNKVAYNGTHKRNPFALPVGRAASYPPGVHVIAAHLAVESMRLLGTFVVEPMTTANRKKSWAFIVAADGHIYKVMLGSVVGSHHAIVTRIEQRQVVFMEKRGKQSRAITLSISEPQ